MRGHQIAIVANTFQEACQLANDARELYASVSSRVPLDEAAVARAREILRHYSAELGEWLKRDAVTMLPALAGDGSSSTALVPVSNTPVRTETAPPPGPPPNNSEVVARPRSGQLELAQNEGKGKAVAPEEDVDMGNGGVPLGSQVGPPRPDGEPSSEDESDQDEEDDGTGKQLAIEGGKKKRKRTRTSRGDRRKKAKAAREASQGGTLVPAQTARPPARSFLSTATQRGGRFPFRSPAAHQPSDFASAMDRVAQTPGATLTYFSIIGGESTRGRVYGTGRDGRGGGRGRGGHGRGGSHNAPQNVDQRGAVSKRGGGSGRGRGGGRGGGSSGQGGGSAGASGSTHTS